MYLKSNAIKSNEFFTSLATSDLTPKRNHRLMTIQKNYTDLFFQFTQPVRMSNHTGLSLLVVTKEPEDAESYREFVLSGPIQLKAGVYFNTLAITDQCIIELEPTTKEKPKTLPTLKRVQVKEYNQQFSIDKLHSVFYQMTSSSLESIPTNQQYYELMIVDQGEVTHVIDGRSYTAKENDCILYYPGQTTQQLIQTQGVTSFVSFSFDASHLSNNITNKIFHCGPRDKKLIERMIELSSQSDEDPFSNDELLIYLKYILVRLLRGDSSNDQEATTSMRENYENELFQSIVDYLYANVEVENKVSDLVEQFSLSRSTIQSLFKKYANSTPKQYINKIRLNRSKRMIRETQLTLSEIADQLGFGSIQYFSRAFSREFGMSPSSYAKSILP